MVLAAVLATLVLAVYPGNSKILLEGCFETNYVEKYSWYYRINHSPLTWEEAEAVCNNRLTTHMGLRMVDSSSTFFYVYCGNSLPDVLTKVESSKCLPCQDSKEQTCKGPHRMSVYKLRGDSPLAVLLATPKGTYILEGNTTILRMSYRAKTIMDKVDYLYTDDSVYLTINQSLFRSDFNYNLMKYGETQQLADEVSLRTLRLAVDHIRREVYWGIWHTGETFKTVLRTMNTVSLEELRGDLFHFCLDAYSRLLFYILVYCCENHHPAVVFRDDLTSGAISNFNLSHHIESIEYLTIDTHQQLLYAFIIFKGDPANHLVRWDYNVSGMVVLYKFHESKHPDALDVFKNTALWVEARDNKNFVYTCKLTPRCLWDNMHIIYETSVRINDMKIYHPERQTPGERRLCANMACSHYCRAISPFTAGCSCPPHLILSADNTTCISDPISPTNDWPQPTMSQTIGIINSISFTQTPENEREDSYQRPIDLIDILHTIILLILLICVIMVILRLHNTSPGDMMSDQSDQQDHKFRQCSNIVYDVVGDTISYN